MGAVSRQKLGRPSPTDASVMTVSFVIFIGILVYAGVHKTVLRALDKRSADIQAELDEAQRLKREAQALLEAYQRKQQEAEQEAAAILAGARAEAERLMQEAKVKIHVKMIGKGWKKIIDDHAGTPWAVIAVRESMTALGLEWRASRD